MTETLKMINFILIFNRQSKIRLQKWYDVYSNKEKRNIIKDVAFIIMNRNGKMSNILEWKSMKVVYKRYASLIILFAISTNDNELMALELMHRYVEVLDSYFVNVCELDIIFNFEKAYFLLDELIMAGEIQDTSPDSVVNNVHHADSYEDEELKTLNFADIAFS